MLKTTKYRYNKEKIAYLVVVKKKKKLFEKTAQISLTIIRTNGIL